MPASVIHDRQTVILAMANRLQDAARDELVDLGDERSVEVTLLRAGHDRTSVYRMADEALDLARSALQAAARAATMAAEAGALLLVLAVWLTTYAVLCPAEPVPQHTHHVARQ